VEGKPGFQSARNLGMILGKLRADAEVRLGEKITKPSLPSRLLQRFPAQATKDAAVSPAWRCSGSSTNPPPLARLRSRQEERRRIAVYDLGGGTFDISVLESAMRVRGQATTVILTWGRRLGRASHGLDSR